MTWQLHSGSGAPGTITGQTSGDNYIDYTTGDLYQLVGSSWSKIATWPKTSEAMLSLSDVTTGDADGTKHGLMPKATMTAWSSFTPSWTNLTVGSATNVGYYKQIGKTVFFRVRLIFANNTSISGGVVLTLPVTAASYGTKTAIGLVKAVDDSTGTEYYGNIHSDGNIGVLKNTTYVSQATITASIPFTWATNDTLVIQGFYEAS